MSGLLVRFKPGLAKQGLLIAILLISGCSDPDFYDTNGVGHSYADFDGKWRIVNYWATWCGPCIHEIPELNSLAKEQSDLVVVLGVNFDEPEGEEAVQQVQKMKIEFPVYARDPSRALGISKPEVLPTTVIITPDGSVHQVLVGPQTADSLLALLK